MTNLICNSFDEQYKRIQTFRNHYLNMIRILLKNKSNLNLKQIMTYNEIELNTNQLMNSITEFIKDIKNTKENKKLNLNNNLNNEDIKIIHTLSYFLPFMLLYYNTLNLNTSDNNNNHQYNDSNNDSNNITNNTTLEIPLD
jgi:hypothetical protein